ncbi:MAG: glycosyltransferase family 2 protein, partial [Promethearchaeota archaeon]
YLLYRKSLIKNGLVGIFDRYIHLYGEDTDLCYRVLLQGYKIALILSTFVYHGRYLGGKKKISTEYSIISKFKISAHSILYLRTKWFGLSYAFLQLCKILLSMIKDAFVDQDFLKIKGKLLGILKFFKDFSFIYTIRRNLQKKFPNFKKTVSYIKELKIRDFSDNLSTYIDPTVLLKSRDRKIFNSGIFKILKF